MFSDQDDVFYPEKLQVFRQKIREGDLESRSPVLIFSDQTVTDANANVISNSMMDYQKQSKNNFDYRCLIFQNVVTGGASMQAKAWLNLHCSARISLE